MIVLLPLIYYDSTRMPGSSSEVLFRTSTCTLFAIARNDEKADSIFGLGWTSRRKEKESY